MPDEQLIKALEKISNIFKGRILTAIQSGASREELARLIAQSDFFEQLEPGLIPELEKFFNEYDTQINELYNFASRQKINSALSINRDVLEALKIVNLRDLLGKARDYANILQVEMINGIIAGRTQNEIKQNLTGINLTDNQMNTAISTGYRNYGRALTDVAFPEPEQKFIYGFGREIGERNIRETCEQALILQKQSYPEGVTKAQIENGVYEGIDFIKGGGWNCSHRFLPATKEVRRLAS